MINLHKDSIKNCIDKIDKEDTLIVNLEYINVSSFMSYLPVVIFLAKNYKLEYINSYPMLTKCFKKEIKNHSNMYKL